MADRFLKQVPVHRRSRHVTAAITERLALRGGRLARACNLANRDTDSLAIADEWEQTKEQIKEPWDDAPARVSARTPFLRP